MKRISPKKGGVAKEVAKTLAKIVGKGLAVGGGVAALGLGIAGCESTPVQTAPTQTLEGPIVNIYKGASTAGDPARFVVIDTDGNPETTADQKHIFVYEKDFLRHPELVEGAIARFQWTPFAEQYGNGGFQDIILINNQRVQH
ncbi:MAG: hypothetical protein LBK73_04700 [Treponema sp.]|jgi:hypothetical protein|nr:hypothetical protein [Treponema sp.]